MFVFNEFPENWTINMIIRQWCKQSFNTLEWTSIRLFPWDFHRWQSRERLSFDIRQKFKGERFGAEPTVARYIHMCGYVRMQVRCLSRTSRKWVTFYPRFDSLMGWGGTSATNQTCSKKNTREKFDGGTGWEEESPQKGYKKHSRKDVASYISNALLEISERQELGAEENLDGKREE